MGRRALSRGGRTRTSLGDASVRRALHQGPAFRQGHASDPELLATGGL